MDHPIRVEVAGDRIESDMQHALTEEILLALARSDLADAVDRFVVRRLDDSEVVEVDLDEPETVYRITVALHARQR